MAVNKALVLLSGGLDSAVCFFSAIQKYAEVVAMSFDYGQRHANELSHAWHVVEYARHFKKKNYEHIVQSLKLPKGTSAPSALTSRNVKFRASGGCNNLPTSFVPGRNLLFLSFACTHAMVRGIDDVIIGATSAHSEGYPDCTPEFIESFNKTFCEATKSSVKVMAPLMYMPKAKIFAVHAGDPKLFEFIVYNTMSCFEGDLKSHAWGMGCGKCPSCKIRAKGWKEFKCDQKRTK